MGEEIAAPDAVVAEIAASQHGVATAAQLGEAGLGPNAVAGRCRRGRLHRQHHGVYAVGHAGLSQEGRWMAAVLACCGHGGIAGADAFLSHRSAAALWRLLPPAPGPVDVAILGEAGRARRPGVRIHRPRTLETSMITSRLGIPLTSPARTIIDLRRARPSRGGASAKEVRRALRQAAIMELPLGPAIRLDRTRSDLERSFLRLCERHRLPAPENNVEVDGMELDFVWRASKVVVETDGYQFHGNRIAFEEDRKRDLRLRALGYQVVRLSYFQVTEEARDIVATLRPLLAQEACGELFPRRGKNSPR